VISSDQYFLRCGAVLSYDFERWTFNVSMFIHSPIIDPPSPCYKRPVRPRLPAVLPSNSHSRCHLQFHERPRIGNALGHSLNMFWMSPLVFSIMGRVNGLFGVSWKQSVRSVVIVLHFLQSLSYYFPPPLALAPCPVVVASMDEGSPDSPLVFLVIAITCFPSGWSGALHVFVRTGIPFRI